MSKSIFSQPSPDQSHFAKLPSANVNRSRFDRSSGLKTTFDAGKLVPVFVDEVLPGDTFSLTATSFTRFATPLKPLMDNIKQDIHFFFVPNRLVWDDFTKFMGERPDPDFDPSTLTVPELRWRPKSNDQSFKDANELAQYFGLPFLAPALPSATDYIEINALPFRAYQLIYNEWYRDENFQDSIPVYRGNDPKNLDSSNGFKVLPRGKRKDYFTSALPWPQKGDPVTIPLGDTADLSGFLNFTPSGTINTNFKIGRNTGYDSDNNLNHSVYASPTRSSFGQDLQNITFSGSASQINLEQANAKVDLSTASAINVNDLREAFQIQKLLERDARGGTRYIELILSHFGVMSDDARLQRPEYLGGGSFTIGMNPIAQTAGDVAPVGELGAYATGVGSAGFSKSFTEHGFIIGISSVRADLNYQQGVERFWSRKTRYDFYWPSLAHLGEQAILNKEIYLSGDSNDDDVFGYQERYAEYRYKPSRITGKFNSNSVASLDVWHLAQNFDNLPVLGADFIVENPPINRVIAVQNEPQFLCDIWFKLKTDRPMPVYAVPGLIDHF